MRRAGSSFATSPPKWIAAMTRTRFGSRATVSKPDASLNSVPTRCPKRGRKLIFRRSLLGIQLLQSLAKTVHFRNYHIYQLRRSFFQDWSFLEVDVPPPAFALGPSRRRAPRGALNLLTVGRANFVVDLITDDGAGRVEGNHLDVFHRVFEDAKFGNVVQCVRLARVPAEHVGAGKIVRHEVPEGIGVLLAVDFPDAFLQGQHCFFEVAFVLAGQGGFQGRVRWVRPQSFTSKCADTDP